MLPLGGGIGRATASSFAQAGATGRVIADIDLQAAKNAASDIMAASKQPGFRVQTVAVDIAVQESVESAFKQMVDSFGRIDYCVSCVGVSFGFPLVLATLISPNNSYHSDPSKDSSANRRCSRVRVHSYPERQRDRDILRSSGHIGHHENPRTKAKLSGHGFQNQR